MSVNAHDTVMIYSTFPNTPRPTPLGQPCSLDPLTLLPLQSPQLLFSLSPITNFPVVRGKL